MRALPSPPTPPPRTLSTAQAILAQVSAGVTSDDGSLGASVSLPLSFRLPFSSVSLSLSLPPPLLSVFLALCTDCPCLFELPTPYLLAFCWLYCS